MQDWQAGRIGDVVDQNVFIGSRALPSGAVSARLSGPRPQAWAKGARLAAVAGLIALAGCSGPTTRAPIIEGGSAGPSAPGASSSAPTYVVKPGDTLYGIARATGTDFETIKRLNSLSDPNQLTVGQVLRLNAQAASGPAAGGIRPASSAGTAIKPPPSSSSQPRPLDDVPDTSAAAPLAAPTPAPAPSVPTPAPAADAGAINWAWPASGTIIQNFDANTKGIDISGTPGDVIKAAADGKVMYIGNGVRGLGNLVIVNHDNGFITVYGHNRKLLVKTGQQVKRGEIVAELGDTETTSPRLHFEVRRRGTPVDPLRYLPAR